MSKTKTKCLLNEQCYRPLAAGFLCLLNNVTVIVILNRQVAYITFFKCQFHNWYCKRTFHRVIHVEIVCKKHHGAEEFF